MAEDNISNILSNFKNMLNNNSNSQSSSNVSDDKKDENNLNITPEMIGNLANMLKSGNSDDSSASSNFSHSENSSNSNEGSNSSANNIDFETILKLKSIMETLNKKDDPRSNLLYSLKPYLRESKQKKLDQYVNLFKITRLSNFFKNEKGAGN